QMASLAGTAGPVQVARDRRRLDPGANRLGDAGHFLGAFLLVAQQHQEGAELHLLDAAIEQHAHGVTGLLAGQVAGAALTLAEDADVLGEEMFGSHMQFVGFGRPASLGARLAGAALNRRWRCRRLPLSGPSCGATYRSSGRVAGDSGNSP